MRIEDYLLCILFDSFPRVTLCITIKDFGWVTCKDISETCFSLEIQLGRENGDTTSMVLHEAILHGFEIHNQINLAKLVKDLLWQKLRVHGSISVKLCYHQFGYFLWGANMPYETQYLDQH